jgi:hypothetical protein
VEAKFGRSDLNEVIYSSASHFEIDGFLQKLRNPSNNRMPQMHPRWDSEPSMQLVFRRALENAVTKADMALHQQNEEYSGDDWKRTEEHAKRAAVAVRELLKFIAPQRYETPIIPLLTQYHVGIKTSHPLTEARDDAQALFHIDELLHGLETFAAVRLSAMSSNNNPGRRDKAAFTLSLAETWIGLTGRMPGKQAGSNGQPNLFEDFVSAAWRDAGAQGEDENFTRAIRAAVDALKARIPSSSVSTHVPNWLLG